MSRQVSRSKKQAAKRPPDAPVAPLRAGATSRGLPIYLGLGLALAALLVYLQTLHYGFVYYDDDRYVYENPLIKSGLSAAGIAWAFTTYYFANWHPLTWISYLADQQFFGINPGEEHAVNALFHAGAAALLFAALFVMTRRPWRSALVAAIFALHPLHVESVAWIAERKDVLSTFFETLTLLLYVRYVHRPKWPRYCSFALAFVLSLLAKPMAVTLPLVLLLLDIWPLGRFKSEKAQRLLWEKAPLLAMSAVASVLTFRAQRAGGAMISLAGLPFAERLANAATAYIAYIGKALWPADLAVLYPIRVPSPSALGVAVLILAAISAVAFVSFRRRPYLLVGWAWYLGMLVPAIGLVQVGRQSMADRYTYLPLVGLSIALVWLIADVTESSPVARRVAAAAGVAAILALTVRTYNQISYWKDSETLFRHALAVTGENPVIEGNLGVVLQRAGRRDEAAALYRQASAADATNAGARTNLGELLAEQGKFDEAVSLYRQALSIDPAYPDAHANLGREYLRTGRMDDAVRELSEAVRGAPESAQCHEDLGLALASMGRYAEARDQFDQSSRINPTKAETQNGLCFVLEQLGQAEPAVEACRAALRVNPDLFPARFNLGTALASEGQVDAAAAEFSRVLAQNPNYTPARVALQKLKTK